MYEDLLEYDFALKPVPGLAESWTVSPDGRTITFRRTFGEGQDSSHDEAPGNLVDIARCQRQPETGGWGSRRHVGSVASPLGVYTPVQPIPGGSARQCRAHESVNRGIEGLT